MASASFPYRILVVEDDPALREIARHLLGSKGYEVLGAEDGFEGLTALKRSLPDVIISDLRMPNMNGIDTLRALRELPSPPKVVVLSNLELDEEIYRAIEEGAMAYLPKNTPRDEIVTAVKTVHGGSIYFPKRIEERLLERKQRRDTCEGGVENSRKALQRYWLTRVLKELFLKKWNASAILRVRGPRSSRLPCSPP